MRVFEQFNNFSTGVQVFVPENERAYTDGEPTKGFGIIRYPEGSIYYGDVYFDGKSYEKLGFGIQNFMNSKFNIVSKALGIRRAFYIGQYDYRVTQWIYGNGVMYYVDNDNHPSAFSKGFYSGLDKIGEYKGEFDYSQLSDGYLPEMEREITHWGCVLADQMAARDNVKELDNLFIGDSYFEYWNRPEFADRLFYDIFSNDHNLNIGIGGTKFSDWMAFLDTVKTLPQPKRIFLNLGFNDVHWFRNAQRPYEDYLTLLGALKTIFPQAEYYLLNVVQSPAHVDLAEEETKLNSMTVASARELGVTVVDMRSAIQSAGGMAKAFHPDASHLNAVGYTAFAEKIKSII